MLSVNQINAQVKILEIWKAHHVENYPLKIEKKHYNPNTAVTRAANNSLLNEKGFSQISSKTFKNDAVRVWNKCPSNIKDCKMIYSAKKAMKDYVMNLPI